MEEFIKSLQPLPLPEQMRQWDENAVSFGIPEEMLMENAARACADLIRRLNLVKKGSLVWLFMGNGNNGGDAAALARHLADAGARPKVFTMAPFKAMKGAAGMHARLARQDGVEFIQLVTPEPAQPPAMALLRQICGKSLDRPALIVDGLLGTGFTGALRPGVEMLLNAINALARFLDTPVFAIDAPSGLNCETGQPQPVAIRAAATLTLAAAKPGLVLPQAREWVGNLYCRKIGMPGNMDKPAQYRLLDGTCLLTQPPLLADSCKNSFGHVYVLGGSANMKGAPVLAALGALRAGAGLATICAPAAVCEKAASAHPEIMILPVNDGEHWPATLAEDVKTRLQKADALIIGPGMGRDASAMTFLKVFLELPQRPATVFDADSLYLLSRDSSLISLTNERDVLTPHPGEAGFLLNCPAKTVQQNRSRALGKLLALTRSVVTLKGAATILGQRDRPYLLCPYDVPQMAIAGAGDVLSGCMGAMLARERESAISACAKAVAMHVMAGLLLAADAPGRGILATDLANALSRVPDFLQERYSLASPDGKLPWPA